MIARWGYSPAIGFWQTVSEINGTNAGKNTDLWHERIQTFFADNDPYRHPTTASMSGDVDWAPGHLAMDIPQMHSYESSSDPVGTAQVIARWTQTMWERTPKPNWIGEFGSSDERNYPELFHNAIWAALASGAAATPMEWNDNSQWGRMTSEMYEHMSRLRVFIADFPLVQLDPSPLELSVIPQELRAWGMGGKDWGFVWVVDYALHGEPIETVRAQTNARSDVFLSVNGLQPGRYVVRPYDTWERSYLSEFEVDCSAGSCDIPLPEFRRDIVIRLEGD